MKSTRPDKSRNRTMDALKKKNVITFVNLELTDKKKANANTMIITFQIQNGIRKKCFYSNRRGIRLLIKNTVKSVNIFPVEEVINVPTTAEKILKVIAIIVLIFGIIASITTLFTIGLDRYNDITFTGLVISLGILLTSVATWSVLRIIVEIAINVRETKHKTKELALKNPSD